MGAVTLGAGCEEGAGFGAADVDGVGDVAAVASAFFGLRLMMTLLIFVGLTERSPLTSTLESLSMTVSGPHLPKIV